MDSTYPRLRAGLLSLALGVGSLTATAEAPVLRIYGWENFLDPALAAEFGKRHGVTVQQTFYDSDWERDLRLTATGGAGFDLVMVDSTRIPLYRSHGWLEELGQRRVPGLAHMEQRWRKSADGTATHAMPYAWGTLGLAYRSDLVSAPIDSWMALFKPSAELCGKILVVDDAHELIAIALKALGWSANTTDPKAYRQVEQLLADQHHCVAGYRNPGVDQHSDLVTGKITASMAYSSDASQIRARNPNVRFILPREGGLIWIDYFVVLRSSQRKSLAFAFLEFLCDPKIAARQARYNGAAIPDNHARLLLPPAMRDDAWTYPTQDRLRGFEMLETSPADITELRNKVFATIVRPD